MTDEIVGGLVPQSTVERRLESGDAPDWVAAHWTPFRDGLLGERNDTPLPCFFSAEPRRRLNEHASTPHAAGAYQ